MKVTRHFATRLLLNVIGLTVISAYAQAAATSSVTTMENTLYTDCGQWVTGRANGNSQAMDAYLIGLLNGLSLGHAMEFWHASGHPTLSGNAVFVWMDEFCRSHPLDGIVHGAVTLYIERSGWKPDKTP